MGFRGGHTITVNAEVSIDDFEDVVILEAAIEAIQAHRKTEKPTGPNWQIENWQRREAAILKIAAALSIDVQADDLPPPSTAAKITSMEELRSFLAKQRGGEIH